jgi:hypothetical protein
MSTLRTLRFSRISWIFPSVAALLVAQACADRAGDCDANSKCTGGSSNAGTAGNMSEAGTENGGSSSGKAGTNGAGGKGGNPSGGTSAGGGGAAGAAGEGGSEAGAGGTPVTPPCGGDCPSATPVCKEATDTCVECLAPSDCTTGVEKKCDTASNNCVECLASADCSDPKAAKCDQGACAKCTANDDCLHVTGKGVCDGGTCVQCTAADETACGGKSCNPKTKACTATTTGSVSNCMACVADSECAGGNQADPDARCIPMTYAGTLRPDGFCLRRTSKTCTRPYKIPVSGASLSGAPSESYCGVDQDLVRCEAVLDLENSRSCPGAADTSCGCSRDKDGNCTELGVSGLCRTVGVDINQCTYQCGVANDCPNGKTCLGAPTKYCQ